MSLDEANRIAKAAERLRRHSRLPLKVVVPTVAALGAGAAIAVGAIPSSDGTITGCYQTAPPGDTTPTTPYGTLRLIDPSLATGTTEVPAEEYSCNSNEATITWNQQGPPGPTGPQGPAGPAGAQGSRRAARPPRPTRKR